MAGRKLNPVRSSNPLGKTGSPKRPRRSSRIQIGCCGFPKSKKVYYGTFTAVELQNTFYTLPSLDLLERWRNEAPKNFEFTIKACQLITHPASSLTYQKAKLAPRNPERYGYFQPTEEVQSVWQEVLKQAEVLKSKVVVFQSPASFRPEEPNIKNLYQFFEKIDRHGLILCWESRGAWIREPDRVMKICKELDLVDCVDPSIRQPVFGKIFYFRLHGGKDYQKKYSDEDLKFIIEQVKGKQGYLMFNNIYMFDDGVRMKALLTHNILTTDEPS